MTRTRRHRTLLPAPGRTRALSGWVRVTAAVAALAVVLLASGCGPASPSTATPHAPSSSGTPAAQGWTSLSAGYELVCGIRADQSGWCWPPNANGAGEPDGKVVGPFPATPIEGEHHWALLSVGQEHACGLDIDAAIWCWGSNNEGRLGQGTSDEDYHPVPVEVAAGRTWVTLDTGEYSTCAVDDQHNLWCWGQNYYATIGDGTNNDALVPVEVGQDVDWASVSVGDSNACGLDVAGKAWCWGGLDPETPDGPHGGRMPTEATALPTMSSISVENGRHDTNACGIDLEQNWVCGLLNVASGPVFIDASHKWTAVTSSDQEHSCALATDATLWCVGTNESGELGDGTMTSSQTPVQVSGKPQAWRAVSATQDLTCGVDDAGGAWCWGATSRSHDESTDLIDSTEVRRVDDPTAG